MNDSMSKKALLNTIPLHPTKFHVDVWVCDDQETLAKAFHKRYGASYEFYMEEACENAVYNITATQESELKGHKRIVMNVENFDLSIIVHEINHVIYHLAELCGLETNFQSQEWISYMLEYLFERCSDKKQFSDYEV